MTLLKTGSVLVAALSCCEVTGRLSRCDTLKTAGSSDVIWASCDFKGNLDKLSACSVGRYFMLYLYADKINKQCCRRAVAKEGVPLFAQKIVVSGLWSVTKVNVCPHRYKWNFFTPKMSARASFSI